MKGLWSHMGGRAGMALCAVMLAGGAPGAADTPRLELTSLYEWQTRSVTGVSGLELSADGTQFYALSDQGWYLSGSLTRARGALTAVTLETYVPLLGIDGRPSAARRINDWSDAEGLVLDEAGGFWVSFERWARVERFDSPTQPGTALPAHAGFALYAENRQLEALARHPDGALYTFAESPDDQGFSMYRFDEGAWQVTGHIPASGFYAIVGADFDAAGRLFVLERRHVLGRWWQNRIRMLPDVARPSDLHTLWTGGLGAYGNLEGIAVWSAAPLRVTVVSDNNGAGDEITQFLDFVLRE